MDGAAARDVLITLGLSALTGVFTIMWWLLRSKDKKQEDEITLLFQKHDADAQRLQDLELEIAKKHYIKDELDIKFDKMENTFRSGFDGLGAKFDNLSSALIAHMMKETEK
jgi:hypothetical protein